MTSAFDLDRARVGLDRDALVRWLVHGPIVRAGDVMSWDNPERPGFAYPEMSGLWLQLPAARASAAAAGVRARLIETVHDDAVGRDGAAYLFDEGAALAGLLASAPRDGGGSPEPALASLHARIVRAIADGVAARPQHAETRWSTAFGPHLLKLVRPLRAWSRRYADARSEPAIASLLERLLDRFDDDGRAQTDPQGGRTYVHAWCYALEGLLGIAGSSHDSARTRALVRAGAGSLARIQRPDGALPSWHDDDVLHGAGDATAQAVRIWSCVDPHRFARPRARALAWLATLATPSGGLRYRDGSRDVNTWTTIFALQALDFVERGADPACLI
jgi:hypothetical protein